MRFAKPEVLSLCLGNALGACGANVIPLWVGATTKYGLLEISHAGWLASGELFAVAVSVLAISMWEGRAGPRRVAAAAASLVVLANLVALLPATSALIIGRLLNGVGLGGVLACVTGVAARRADAQRVFSLMQAGVVLLLTLVFAASPYLIGRFGLAGLFGLLCGLGLLTLAAVLAGFPTAAGRTNVESSDTRRLRAAPLVGCLAWGLVAVGQGTIWNYIVTIGSGLGLSERSVGSALAMVFPLTALGPFVAHWLGERRGLLAPLLLGLSIMAVDVFVLVASASTITFWIATSLLPMGVLFCSPYAMALLGRFDTSGRSASSAVAFLMIGSSLGPALGSRLAGDFRFQALASVAASCFVVSIMLFSFAGYLNVGRRVPRTCE
jgi:predicted MFS family arabinose efflux permease